jgi:predicted PurR-regulated permease PerM
VGRKYKAFLFCSKQVIIKISMPPKRLQVAVFLLGFAVITVLVFFLLKGYLTLLAFSFILAILFEPLYKRFVKYYKGKNALASLTTVVIMFFMVVIPIWLFGQLFFNEIYNTYTDFTQKNGSITQDVVIQKLPLRLQGYALSVSTDISGYITKYTSDIFHGVSSVVTNIAYFIFALFLLLFTVYYLLKDGEKLKTVITTLSPISDSQEKVLFDKVALSIRGVVFGTFLVAVVQGVVATIGFLIFGLPNAFLWGLFTMVAAVVPTVGTSLIIIPAVIYLFLTGNTNAAIGLAIWGAAAVGTIDNFISPKLVGSRAELHPVLVMFGVIGGLQFFGFLGFLMGPILMAVFVAVIEMYRTDFQKYLE